MQKEPEIRKKIQELKAQKEVIEAKIKNLEGAAHKDTWHFIHRIEEAISILEWVLVKTSEPERIPFEEAILYGGYRIYNNDNYDGLDKPEKYLIVHENYDGEEDHRIGGENTIDECIEWVQFKNSD